MTFNNKTLDEYGNMVNKTMSFFLNLNPILVKPRKKPKHFGPPSVTFFIVGTGFEETLNVCSWYPTITFSLESVNTKYLIQWPRVSPFGKKVHPRDQFFYIVSLRSVQFCSFVCFFCLDLVSFIEITLIVVLVGNLHSWHRYVYTQTHTRRP